MLGRQFQTIKHIGRFLYDLVNLPYNLSIGRLGFLFLCNNINHLKECIKVLFQVKS